MEEKQKEKIKNNLEYQKRTLLENLIECINELDFQMTSSSLQNFTNKMLELEIILDFLEKI